MKELNEKIVQYGFFGLSRQDLLDVCIKVNEPLQHVKFLYAWAYKGLNEDWGGDSQVSQRLLRYMRENYRLDVPECAGQHRSGYDDSVKFLLNLRDDSKVEAVLMPETGRLTLCISSQVGCRQGCGFCHTGRMGLQRNLTAHEIVGQVVAVNRWLASNPEYLQSCRLTHTKRISNIVFMGMGEPLDNPEAVVKSLEILSDDYGLQLSEKRMAVSTAGHLEGLKYLLTRRPKASIALSLHCTDSRKRSQIMPINRRWDYSEVLRYLKSHYACHNPKGWFLVQYTLINGVNDDLKSAENLAKVLSGLPVKVNIIPLNEIDPSRYEAPDAGQLDQFRDVIHKHGIRVMIRYSKGQDISAACGQLVVEQRV